MSIKKLKSSHHDGTFNEIKAQVLGLARNEGLICWNSWAIDSSFSIWERGGIEVAYGYKGKGILIHLLVDAHGMTYRHVTAPANEDERKYVGPLLEMVAVKTGKPGRPPKKLRRITADKFPRPLGRGIDNKCF